MKKPVINSLVRDITYHHKNRAGIFSSLNIDRQAEVLLSLSRNIQSQLLLEIDRSMAVRILEYVDPDEATDLLQTLSVRKQKELLAEIREDLQNKISMLLKFDPKTAAGLMSLNYIQVDADLHLFKVAEQIRVHEGRTGKPPEVLVVKEGKLAGFLPVQSFISARPSDSAGKFSKKTHVIKSTASADSVINKFLAHPHQKMVVMDDEGTILGVIYSDDVLKIIREKEASTLYDFAGVSSEETVFGTVKQKVMFRYKWLILNLATAFLAAFVVGRFEDTISRFVLLAAYMPIVAGMGGNAATQTLAVLVRGIALKQIDLSSALPALKRELGAGFINGLINGALVAGVVIYFNRDWRIALILAAAMIINLLVAGFFGTLVPLVMTKLKKDPATSATVFITTATDVLGFLAFLGLASLVLG